jgi:putative NADH-flavin reductase
MRVAVTGAYGFSGKYMARRLLDLRHEVITLTNSPNRSNPFGKSIKAFLYNFSEPHELEKSLRGAILRPAVLFGKEDILINNIAPNLGDGRDQAAAV